MFREIGLKFGLKGFDSAKSQIQQFGGAFQQMSGQVSSGASSLSGKLDMVASHTKRMSTSIVSSLNLAKAAFATFLAGRALSGIAGMLGGTSERGQGLLEDYLRAAQFEPKQLTEHMFKLRTKVPGLPRTEYMGGAYDAVSVLAEGGPDMVKKGMESMTYLWKSLGPEASRQEAGNLIRGVVGAWGIGKAPGEVLKIIEQFEATIPPILNKTGIKGHELANSLSQVISIYKEKGLTLQDMVAETAAIGGVMKERTGEVLRNIQTRLVEGTAELAAKVGLEMALAKRGVTRLEDLPEEEAKYLLDSVKKTEDAQMRRLSLIEKQYGSKGMAEEIKAIWEVGKQLEATRGFPFQKHLKSAFGETAPQGLPLWVEAQTSGKIDELKKQHESVEKQRADREAAWQSYEARYTILEQRVENLKQATLSGFKAVLTDIYEGYGETLDNIVKSWSGNTNVVSDNLRTMLHSAGEAFKASFGADIPGILESISKSALKLVEMPKEDLEASGARIGSALGGAFKTVYEAVAPLNAEFGSMIPNIKGVLEGLNLLLGPLRALAYISGRSGAAAAEIMNDPKAMHEKTMRDMELQRAIKEQKEAAAIGSQLEPYKGFESNKIIPPEKDKSWFDRIRDAVMGPQAQEDGQPSSGQLSYEVPESNFQIACSINIDGASLDGIVDAKVDKIMQDHRMGYGEYGFARPFMG